MATSRAGVCALNQTPASILYVITDLEVGGVPLHLHRLARAMKTHGFRPAVVSLAPAGPVAEMLREDAIAVYSCEGRGGWDFRVIGRLARIIEKTRPDIVHALLFHANVAARRAAKKADFPRERLVCEIQTVEVERRWHLWMDRVTHRGCRFTIGNSPSVIEHLAARARIPRDRLRLVRGGIDPKPPQEAEPLDRTTLDLPPNAPLVLWVGRLDPVKGLDKLLQAFHLVVKSEGEPESARSNAHLLLAGDGPLHPELARQIEHLELQAQVHLLGARDDVPKLLKTADVFVFPSRTEGLPNALLEAMAAGCPIVTTDVPGCRDLIEHERTGLIVPYGDTKALATAISRLLRNPTIAQELAGRAAKEVTERWHVEGTYDAYADVYAEILAAP